MMYPLLTQLARAEAAIPVAVSCRVLEFSRQAYCSWVADPVSARDLDNAHLMNAALDIHHDDPSSATASSPTSSTRPGTRCLNAGSGDSARRRACPRSMPAHAGEVADRARRCTTTSCVVSSPRCGPTGCGRPTSPSTPPRRASSTSARSRTPARGGSCYSMNDRMTSQLAVTALSGAVARRGGPAAVAGCTIHSDRGSSARTPSSTLCASTD